MATLRNTESGFTLVELMTAMAMAGIVIGVIYAAYNIQTKIYTEQDKTAEMQQNIRAGMAFLQREVRMAGYDSEGADAGCGAGATSASPGIHTATATEFGFSMDLDEDGKCDGSGENVTYSIYTADGMQKLGRKAPTTNAAVAENIDGINFVYIFSSPTAPTSTPTVDQLDDIVAVQVSLLARASTPDRKVNRTTSLAIPFPDASGAPVSTAAPWGQFTDSISRRLLTTTINCRNMGLN